MTPIYLDNAASTRVDPTVIALMTEVMTTAFGNPSSVHPQGVAAREHIAKARARVLAAIGDPGGEDRRRRHRVDLRLHRGRRARRARRGAVAPGPGAIVVSAIEHAAVGADWPTSLARLRPRGRRGRGRRRRRDRSRGRSPRAVVDHEAGTVAIVMVQNEIGVVQPVAAAIAAVRVRRARRAVPRPRRRRAGARQGAARRLTTLGCRLDRVRRRAQAARAQGHRRAVAAHRLHRRAAVGRRRPARRPARWYPGRARRRGLRGSPPSAARRRSCRRRASGELELAGGVVVGALRCSAASARARWCPTRGARRTSSRSACRRRAGERRAAHGAREPRRLHLDRLVVQPSATATASRRTCSPRSACPSPTPAWCGCRSGSTPPRTMSTRPRARSPTSRSSWQRRPRSASQLPTKFRLNRNRPPDDGRNFQPRIDTTRHRRGHRRRDRTAGRR